MLRSLLLLLTMTLALPSFASAYNVWNTTKSTSPTSQAAFITAPANSAIPGYNNVGNVTYATSTSAATIGTAPDTMIYAVAEPVGFKLLYVTIDGVKQTSILPGNFTVAKGTKVSHTISATYAAANYTIAASVNGNGGSISPAGTYTVKSGTSKSFVITPWTGYTLSGLSVSADSTVNAAALATALADITAANGNGSATYTFSNVQASTSLVATFTINAQVQAAIAPVAQGSAIGTPVVLDGSASTSNVTATYTWAIFSPAVHTGVTLTPSTDGKTAILASAAVASTVGGEYVIRLTLSASGATTSTVNRSVILVTQSAAGSGSCIVCHSTREPQKTADFVASKHATQTSAVNTGCSACHTSVTGTAPNTVTNTMAAATQIVCASCHNTLVVGAGHTVAQAACSTCHTFDSHSLARTPVAGTSTVTHSGGVAYTSATQNPPPLAQYTSAQVVCANCHASSNAAILAEFKQSGHGDVDGEGWKHYDWRNQAAGSSNRTACQRCHNGSAYANQIGLSNYSTATLRANFTVADKGKPGEVLNCGACHSDVAAGTLRAATAVSTSMTNGATSSYSDAGASNICIRCHSGRETGDSIKNIATLSTYSSVSFVDSHYMTSAGTVYNKTGYHFSGQVYDQGFHKNIGKDNLNSTGTKGACVACHMDSGAGHTWTASATSPICANCHSGLTTTALEEAKGQVTLALAELQAALAGKGILFAPSYPYYFADSGCSAFVAATGVCTATDPATANDGILQAGEMGRGNAFKNWAKVYGKAQGANVMGATFNFQLISHDPGAFAHNKSYALKLIADSLDFLNDTKVGTESGNVIPANTATTVLTAAVHIPVVENGCASCHATKIFPTAASHYGGAPFNKAQYVSAASLPVTCANCHSGTANQAILAQYTSSAHADTAGEAWLHYDWRGANRSACARCHNGSAFVAKLGNENVISNVFQPGDILKPGEVLACSACHLNVGTGALRTAAQSFTINMTNSTVAYDVAGASGLCVRCHSGRETGQSIKNDTDTTGIRVFLDSHYQPAAGTVYNKSGYDYGDNATLVGHKTLGDTLQGPCVSCHMAGKNHSFAAASCVTCHNGTIEPTLTIDAATRKANYDTALNNLKAALAAKGIHYGPVHPFFFTAVYTEVGPNTPVTDWSAAYGAANWKHTMGAAFNYNMLWSEKGAYAHDYNYAMKLITDSTDFISDGVLGL